MCNTLYMFNTILMEVMGYGGKTNNQQTELEMEQYVKSLYLTDFSNMLLAIHSATNWLIFYHWPRFATQQRKKKLSTLTLTSNAASKTSSISMNFTSTNFVIDTDTVEVLAERFSQHKYAIATKILTTLCLNSQQMSRLLMGNSDSESEKVDQNSPNNNNTTMQDTIAQNKYIQKSAIEIGDLIEKVINGLANKSSIFEWRDMCRRIGYANYKINLYFSATEWKLVRNVLVESMSSREIKSSYCSSGDSNVNLKSENEKSIGCGCCVRNCGGRKYSQQLQSLQNSIINSNGDKNQQLPQQAPKRSKCYEYRNSGGNFLGKRRQSFAEIFSRGSERQLDREFGLSNLQRAMCKAFNFALREMKSGALCAIVDASRCHQQHVVYSQRMLNIGGSNHDFATTSSVDNFVLNSPEKRFKSSLSKAKTPCHKVHSDFSPCINSADEDKHNTYINGNTWRRAYGRSKYVKNHSKTKLDDESFQMMNLLGKAAHVMPRMPRRRNSERGARHNIPELDLRNEKPQGKASDEERNENYRKKSAPARVTRQASKSTYFPASEGDRSNDIE